MLQSPFCPGITVSSPLFFFFISALPFHRYTFGYAFLLSRHRICNCVYRVLSSSLSFFILLFFLLCVNVRVILQRSCLSLSLASLWLILLSWDLIYNCVYLVLIVPTCSRSPLRPPLFQFPHLFIFHAYLFHCFSFG